MAKKNKFNNYSKKIRKEVQFARIDGLKISKSVLGRFKKGSHSVNALVKNLERYNKDYLTQLHLDKSDLLDLKTQLRENYSPENYLKVLHGKLGSKRYKFDQTYQIRQYASKAIQESMSEEEIKVLKATINETNLDLNSFNYNPQKQRLEKVTSKGTIWIKVETSLATSEDHYPEQIVTYNIE